MKIIEIEHANHYTCGGFTLRYERNLFPNPWRVIGPLVNERLPHDTVGPSNLAEIFKVARELSEARRETLRSKVKEFFGQ